MGWLLIDHRGGQGIDGLDGMKQEFDTVPCGHCGAIIAILCRPTEKLYLDNIDVAKAAMHGQHLGHEYKGKRPCRHCRKPLCRVCFEKGTCDPLIDQIERSLSSRNRERT